MKTCLTCKYEPDWRTPNTHGVQQGDCKWPEKFPLSFQVVNKPIARHKDDSGIYVNCPVWEEK